MNPFKLISRIVSALSALAVLNQVVTPDTMNLLNTLHPKASALAAGLGVVGLVCTEASVKIAPILKAMKRNPGRSSLAGCVFLALVFGLGFDKCDTTRKPRNVRIGLAVVDAGATFTAQELERLVQAGDIPAEDAAVIRAAVAEFKALSGGFVTRAADWNTLTRAQRIALGADAINRLSESAGRLAAQNAFIKSDKAKQFLRDRQRDAHIAVAGLRIAQAALEAGEDPEASPTPSPTPTPAPTS